ncbi:MAG: hypothetical protein ACI8WB_000555 [Phenylobacterium sp.]|jgi:hypothetical protein
MPTYRQAPHRHLKNRSLKRRVNSHQYHSEPQEPGNQDFIRLRAHQSALSKLKRQPELIDEVWQNLYSKQQQDPKHPQLAQWHQLLESCSDIESLSEKVLDCGAAANELRKYSVLDCLFDDKAA